ncbi:exodeoxyribonuclease VII small subunit [Candidatus Saccharibacteria bacterium]|nr:exodeoxyribonuclease VII small subunit [Candidatus Saccharibacteria bacterium]
MANKSYRELKEQLDEVLARLQQDDIDIDEAMKLHQHGTKLVTELETYLKTAENKITKHKRA